MEGSEERSAAGRARRAVALGAAGAMGRVAANVVAAQGWVDELVIADRDRRAAEAVASDLGARAATVDATDPRALRELFDGAAIVMSSVGPYFRFGVPILEAAIAAGCDYVDICDDWEPTLEMLDLDGRAREAGVSCVIGLGASPGISNLLAAKAASGLDEVTDLITGWSLEDPTAAEGIVRGGHVSAAVEHWLHQCSGSIRVLRDGDFRDVKPIERVDLHLPRVGRHAAYTVGHPEPVTLPRTYPGLARCLNVMVGDAAEIAAARWYRWRIDRTGMTVADAARGLGRIARAWGRSPFSHDVPTSMEELRYPAVFAQATGRADGQGATVTATAKALPGGAGMASVTGVPLAVGVALLAKGKVGRRGVFAPEAGIDPDDFFDEMAPLCTPPAASGADVVEISAP